MHALEHNFSDSHELEPLRDVHLLSHATQGLICKSVLLIKAKSLATEPRDQVEFQFPKDSELKSVEDLLLQLGPAIGIC